MLSLLDRQSLLANMAITRHSPHIITERAALDAEIARIAMKGLGIDKEEFARGMIAVALPVLDRDNKLVAAIACHAPTARMSLDDLMNKVPQMRIAADAIREVLFPVPE